MPQRSSSIGKIGLLLSLQNLGASAVFAEVQSIQLPVIEVNDTNSQSEQPYTHHRTASAAKLDLPLADLPQGLEIRNRQVLDDLAGAQRIDDVAKTVAGVNVTWQGNGGTNQPMFSFRGFTNKGDSLKDGYRRFGGFASTSDLSYVEQIEFIKGPTSLQYSNATSLGGQVNYVSKQALDKAFAKFDFNLGSYDFYRATLDVGNRLDQQGRLLGRLNIAIEDAGSYREFAQHGTQAFAPAFSYKLDEHNQLRLLIDYTQTQMRGDFAFPVTPAYRNIPYYRYIQNPDFDHTDTWSLNTTLEFEHRFNDRWKWLSGFSNGISDWYQHFSLPTGLVTPYVLRREPNWEYVYHGNRDIENRLQGTVADAFGWQHQLQLGLSLIQSDLHVDEKTMPKSSFNMLDSINAPLTDWDSQGVWHQENFTVAPYLQDLISLTPQLKLLLGGRYDNVHNSAYKDNAWGVTGRDSQTNGRLTPRLALLYQPLESTMLYASYSTSFRQVINSYLDSNNRFKPESGVQYEWGIKHWITPDLMANLAIYELIRENVVRYDTFQPRVASQVGEQQSHGIELDISGQITRNWRVIANYALTDARVTRDSLLAAGTKRPGVPLHSTNVLSLYHFTGDWEGLELGGSFNYASGVEVEMPNSFRLPATWQLDLIASYRFNPHYKIQLNVKNITDERNYMVSPDYGYITPLSPVAAFLKLSFDY